MYGGKSRCSKSKGSWDKNWVAIVDNVRFEHSMNVTNINMTDLGLENWWRIKAVGFCVCLGLWKCKGYRKSRVRIRVLNIDVGIWRRAKEKCCIHQTVELETSTPTITQSNR